jgi:anti-sigma factor RsiW
MTPTEHTHLSQLAVERYLLGEIAGETRRRFEAEITACPDCQKRVEATAADDRAFALRPVPSAIRDLARKAAPAPAAWPWRWLIAVPAAAAAAVIAVVLLNDNGLPTGRASSYPGLIPGIGDRVADDTLRLKGSPIGPAAGAALSLGFYVSRDGAKSVGKPGERLTAGDRIQFWYDGPGAPVFVLVGVDGRGAVTTYLPERAGEARALTAGRGLSLGAAIELDDAKGVERFFLCTGPAAADTGAVERAAHSLADARADLSTVDRLPVTCDQASVWIRKE